MPRALHFLLASLAGVACGGGSKLSSQGADAAAPGGASGGLDGPPHIASGVPATKPLNALTPGEAEKICAATESFARQLAMQGHIADLSCRVAGLITIAVLPEDQAQLACKQAYAMCKAQPPPMMPMGMTPGMCVPPDPSCMATVAEYEACLNSLPMDLALLDRLIPPCERATRLSLAPLLAGQTLLGPACQAFDKKCPGAFGGLATPMVLPPGVRPG
jgi:hypothetical protein